MIWSILLIIAEIIVAASLASTRPFLASFVVGLVVKLHAPDLPEEVEGLVAFPVLAVLGVLAAGEHFLKWRESSSIFDLDKLFRKMPNQVLAVLVGLTLFEALRIAGPSQAVEMLELFFNELGSQLASAIVHLIIGAAVAALAAWLSARHGRAQEWVTQAAIGARWVRNAEALLVVVVALAAGAVFWTLAAVALALLVGIGFVIALRVGKTAIDHGSRIACHSCGYRRARGASVCPKCRSLVERAAEAPSR